MGEPWDDEKGMSIAPEGRKKRTLPAREFGREQLAIFPRKSHGEICQYWYNTEVEKVSKPLFWIGTSRDDLSDFPDGVKHHVGLALRFAQWGDKHDDAKPLKGFGGAGTLEVVTDFDGNTYRTVYTVKFRRAVYVLHAFQKKSKRGVGTPKEELELVRNRLKRAESHYAEWSKDNVKEDD